MKLYLSSIDVPTPSDLSGLLGKALAETTVVLIPNAKDYYAGRAWDFTIGQRVSLLESLGMKVKAVDLRDYNSADILKQQFESCDLIWAMGGNTFMLRHQMRRSGFDDIIEDLAERGVVYGGDSAGALVAGVSIGGINLESSDEPQFAEEIIEDGLGLVPYIIVPHVDNAEFTEVMKMVDARSDQGKIIRLKDSQAVIFNDKDYKVVEAK
jgi:dipeptidase E